MDKIFTFLGAAGLFISSLPPPEFYTKAPVLEVKQESLMSIRDSFIITTINEIEANEADSVAEYRRKMLSIQVQKFTDPVQVAVDVLDENLSHWHPEDLKRYHDRDLSGWNALRKRTYMLADSLVHEYSLPVNKETMYTYLMRTFYVESKYKASAKNPHSSATGLIQWMSIHYRKYGFTREEFASLSEIEQLAYTGQYFRKELKKIKHRGNVSELKDWVDYYCLVYYPKIADKPDWVVMARSCGRKCSPKCSYHANNGYDFNKDGIIRKGEIVKRIQKKLSK